MVEILRYCRGYGRLKEKSSINLLYRKKAMCSTKRRKDEGLTIMKKMKPLCILSSLIGSLVVLFSITSCGGSSTNAATPAWKFAYMSDHKLDQTTDPMNYTNLPVVQRMAADMVTQRVNMVITGGVDCHNKWAEIF